jgi:hypothetical protein
VPSGTSAYNQIGVYVGNSSTALTRDGFLNFGGAPEAFDTNNVGGNDSGLATGGTFFAGDSATATISRVGGNYTETVTDTTSGHTFSANVTPTFSPNTFLSGDLNVGLYAIEAEGSSYSVPFSSFTADVAVPEPGSITALLGLGLCGLLVVSRRRRRG